MKSSVSNFRQQISTKKLLRKYLKIAIFVGIILNIVNQFSVITSLQFQELQLLKTVLTFFVPFAVSVYSAATIEN